MLFKSFETGIENNICLITITLKLSKTQLVQIVLIVSMDTVGVQSFVKLVRNLTEFTTCKIILICSNKKF